MKYNISLNLLRERGKKRFGASIFSFSHKVFYPIKDRNHRYSNNSFVVFKYFL